MDAPARRVETFPRSVSRLVSWRSSCRLASSMTRTTPRSLVVVVLFLLVVPFGSRFREFLQVPHEVRSFRDRDFKALRGPLGRLIAIVTHERQGYAHGSALVRPEARPGRKAPHRHRNDDRRV